MHRFVLPEGAQRAGNLWTRHKAGVSGLGCRRASHTWRIRVDMNEAPVGTTIKLCGVAHVSAFRWRRLRGGVSQLFAWTHEDSDRILARRLRGGRIGLASYVYRCGYGPAIQPDAVDVDWIKRLGTVRNGEFFTVRIMPNDASTVFAINGKAVHHVARSRPLPRLVHKAFVHAGGHVHDASPARIRIDVKPT